MLSKMPKKINRIYSALTNQPFDAWIIQGGKHIIEKGFIQNGEWIDKYRVRPYTNDTKYDTKRYVFEEFDKAANKLIELYNQSIKEERK